MVDSSVISLSGSFYKDKYFPVKDIDRGSYIERVNKEAIEKDYSFFIEIKEDYLIHLDRQFTINYYFRDWGRIIPLLKNSYGEGNFYVVNGFRSPHELGVNVHSTGLAIDILVKNQEEADRLMNAAYLIGIPTIIPAGDIRGGQGHIHLDLAPKAPYVYNSGMYMGPWGDKL